MIELANKNAVGRMFPIEFRALANDCQNKFAAHHLRSRSQTERAPSARCVSHSCSRRISLHLLANIRPCSIRAGEFYNISLLAIKPLA